MYTENSRGEKRIAPGTSIAFFKGCLYHFWCCPPITFKFMQWYLSVMYNNVVWVWIFCRSELKICKYWYNIIISLLQKRKSKLREISKLLKSRSQISSRVKIWTWVFLPAVSSFAPSPLPCPIIHLIELFPHSSY